MSSALVKLRARLAQSALARRFLSGMIWSATGSVISSGITMVTMMLIARQLGKTNYGQFVVIQSTLAMLGVIAGFGIGAAATRYAAELKSRDPTRLGQIVTLGERFLLIFGIASTAVLIGGADWLASRVLNAPPLSKPLQVAAPALFFLAFDSYQKSVLIGLESMRAFAIGTIVGVLASLPVMLFAAGFYGLQGAAGAISVSALFQCVISRYQMHQALLNFNITLNEPGSLQEWPLLWRFALPALLASAVVSPAHWATQAMLANIPKGYDHLAVLGIAMQWFNVIIFFPGTAARVLLPILTDQVSDRNQTSSRKILVYAMCANALVAVPLAVMVGAFSPAIMGLYGETFRSEYLPLAIAAATAVVLCVLTPIGNLLAAASRMWLGSLMNLGWAIVYVGVAYVTIDFGAVAVMASMGIAYVCHAVWALIFARSYLQPQSMVPH